MQITIEPTTTMRHVEPMQEGQTLYGRLWVGVTDLGHPVQAIVFGLALPEGAELDYALNANSALILPDEQQAFGPEQLIQLPPEMFGKGSRTLES